MVPISVRLSGFLSYRDDQTLDFSDRRVWMLSGDNGAGKSSVFDAMTFALYGEHRLGAQYDTELINRASTEATVEFVFQVGSQRYRALRTVKRVGQPGRLLSVWDGREWIPLPGTKSEKAFGQEVRKLVGLNYEAFTASLLLKQGEADRLLNARPPERFEYLKQIIDLSEYEALHRRADDEAKRLSVQVAGLKQERDRIPIVSDDDLATACKDRDDAKEKADRWRVEVERLVRVRQNAARFADLEKERISREQAVAEGEMLTADADAIRRAAARREELDRIVPLLERVHDARARRDASLTAVSTAEEAAREQDDRLRVALGIEEDASPEDIADTLIARIADAGDAKAALPRLETFAERRSEAVAALSDWRDCQARIEANPVPPNWETFGAAETAAAETARTEHEAARMAEADTRALLNSIGEQKTRFAAAVEAGECLYCGQTLTTEQRARQSADLDRREADARDAHQRASKQLDAKQASRTAAENEREKARTAYERQQRAAEAAREAEHRTGRTWKSPFEKFVKAADAIPAEFRESLHIPGDPAQAGTRTDWTHDEAFPTIMDLNGLRARADSLSGWQKRQWSWTEAGRAVETARYLLHEREDALRAAENAVPATDKTAETFGPALRDPAAFAALKTERTALNDAKARLERLTDALKTLAEHRAALTVVYQQRERIPATDRRPVAEVEREEKEARQHQTDADAAYRAAENAVQAKEGQRTARAEREAELLEAEILRDRYKLLADLLGRDRLQRHLLRAAETRVLEKANDSLSRFSGGSLRLEPGPDDGRRGAGTALDLVCHNAETADEPLDLGLLSGSQRFRVAVSLALGIGQYLSGDESRIRSVIIDEGFGSLDTRGLRDMAEEIRGLGEMLDRIIVVSHQEAFAEVFPDRYHIRLDEGASRPERMLATL